MELEQYFVCLSCSRELTVYDDGRILRHARAGRSQSDTAAACVALSALILVAAGLVKLAELAVWMFGLL